LSGKARSHLGNYAFECEIVARVVEIGGALALDRGEGSFDLEPVRGNGFRLVDTGEAAISRPGDHPTIVVEVLLRREGYYHLAFGRPGEAIRLFRLGVEHFPASIQARLALADAYALAGYRNDAATVYRGVLRMDPRNGTAREMLRVLQH